MNPIRHILIVGGGTAGWLTAAFLARTLGTAAGGVRVTLVESSDIGIIGVGEGTFPSIRGTLNAIGLDEARFVRECDATFKQGVNFVDWSRVGERYFHPFNAPSQRPGAPELMPYWLLGEAGERAFADAVSMQQRVADLARAQARRRRRLARPDELRVPLRRRQVRDAAGHARAVAGRRARDRDGRSRGPAR
jgi:tryptophan halogenase